jgi:DNA-directed RNA polymerase subunit RPC12/RpoP
MKDITDDFDDEDPVDSIDASSGVKEINGLPFEDIDESETSGGMISKKFPDESYKPMEHSQKDDSPKPSVPQKKSIRLLPKTLPKLRKNNPSDTMVSSDFDDSSHQVKMKCPNCSRIFQKTISSSTKKIQCPHCQFQGTIKK